MVDRNYWNLLNLKRKIYKTAHAVREAEKTLAAKNKLDLSEIIAYAGFLKSEIHLKTENAYQILENCLQEIKQNPETGNQRKALNICFHNLMDLIEETVQEQFFVPSSVRLFDGKREAVKYKTGAILDNLRSPFNVGSIFRSSDAFGVGELALCGITAKPDFPKVERTAMGTTETVNWQYFEKTSQAIETFREKGYRIIAVETVENAVLIENFNQPENCAFVFGNEEYGITEEIIQLCDGAVEIPLIGMKNSINVANAFSIVMYEMMKKMAKPFSGK